MNIILSFDVEIWCDGWNNLDSAFPASFERYVYGRSKRGEYALPKTLEILNRHRLQAVFFVEPLFSARFGAGYLETIVRLIRDAGQEIQLHLHPEWTDEISPPIIADSAVKRQHLTYYTHAEQSTLIACAKKMLEDASSGEIQAFRAGSYAANRDTFDALRDNGIFLDSSINVCHAVSAPELRGSLGLATSLDIGGVTTFPVSTFVDGFGRQRPAQVGACSFEELREALCHARQLGRKHFIIVSHNFEMLRPDTSIPDSIVAHRFERLCAYLAEHRDAFCTCGYASLSREADASPASALRTSRAASARRYAEQIARRLLV